MASDDFNKASRSGWQIYGAVSGFTTSMCIGVFGLGMATKADASNWWLVMGILGILGTIGSAYNVYSLLKTEAKSQKPHDSEQVPPPGEPDNHPPQGPQP